MENVYIPKRGTPQLEGFAQARWPSATFEGYGASRAPWRHLGVGEGDLRHDSLQGGGPMVARLATDDEPLAHDAVHDGDGSGWGRQTATEFLAPPGPTKSDSSWSNTKNPPSLVERLCGLPSLGHSPRQVPFVSRGAALPLFLRNRRHLLMQAWAIPFAF